MSQESTTETDSAVTVDQTRRGRDITVEQSATGWKIEVSGGGVNPFAGQRFTRFDMAQRAVVLYKQRTARSSDSYIKEAV